jgi:hypothetical protein
MCIGYFFFSSGNRILGSYFLIMAVIMITLFPLYSKWRYKNYYKKYVKEIFANRFDKPVTLDFNDDNIETSDPAGESKIYLSDLDNITETARYFYLHLLSGSHLIIPKANLNNITALKSELNRVSNHLNISYFTELNWKW